MLLEHAFTVTFRSDLHCNIDGSSAKAIKALDRFLRYMVECQKGSYVTSLDAVEFGKMEVGEWETKLDVTLRVGLTIPESEVESLNRMKVNYGDEFERSLLASTLRYLIDNYIIVAVKG